MGFEPSPAAPRLRRGAARRSDDRAVSRVVRESAEPFTSIDDAHLGGLLERIGDARVVLLGEATHGTAEFYQMRSRITRELVLHRGFGVVAVEADWPDAAQIDRRVRHQPPAAHPAVPFERFPRWMWRNAEVGELVDWLRELNGDRPPDRRVSFRGLDLYSMYTSIQAVLDYLDRVDREAAAIARDRYACLTPLARSPEAYGRLALTGRYRTCEAAVLDMLRQLLARRLELASDDGEGFFDALRNAEVIVSAEQYYRAMYYGRVESWNLRDRHMFATLDALLAFHGPESKAVVWEHNSHVGDAAATELGDLGETNVGRLCREAFGAGAFAVGFGTDHGRVVAAPEWGAAAELMTVRPAQPGSYEALCHETGVGAFLLPLRHPRRDALRAELDPRRPERAIGVVYLPEQERASHYFEVSLPGQFDEYVWFDATDGVHPLPAARD
jgi:protein-L-isoaspartate(D-aspartate) O-methyltransferase